LFLDDQVLDQAKLADLFGRPDDVDSTARTAENLAVLICSLFFFHAFLLFFAFFSLGERLPDKRPSYPGYFLQRFFSAGLRCIQPPRVALFFSQWVSFFSLRTMCFMPTFFPAGQIPLPIWPGQAGPDRLKNFSHLLSQTLRVLKEQNKKSPVLAAVFSLWSKNTKNHRATGR